MDERFKQYQRTAIAEMANWHEGFDMTGVSLGDFDEENGSPKLGDKIARNPTDHADRWLVNAEYFSQNFAPVGDSDTADHRPGEPMTTEPLEGMETPDKTALGFGGKTIDRLLEIDDELYLLLKCEIVSDGRAKKDDDGFTHKAGARTTILAELTVSEATQIASDHGG